MSRSPHLLRYRRPDLPPDNHCILCWLGGGQEKVEGVHEFYAILVHLASAPSPAWRGSWGAASTASVMSSIHLRGFRAPHVRTFRANRTVAYSLIHCSLLASSIHVSYREGNAPESLRVTLIPLWHLQLAFRRRGAQHTRAGHDCCYKVKTWLSVTRSSHC